MKILILANSDIGLYNFRKELIDRLLSDGNEVYISLPDGDKVRFLEEMGCKFIDTKIDRRGINFVTDLKLLKTYFKIVKNVKPDIVITYTIKPNIYGGLVCRIKNISYFCNITGLGTAFQNDNWLKKVSIILYKLALRSVRQVFFENCENRDICVGNKIIPLQKTCLLNGAGVNLDDFPFVPYPPEDEIRFLFVGRVMKEKGIEEFCEAAERMKQKYSNIYFDIVGPMEDNYKDYMEKYHSMNIVNYYGFQADVRAFIEKSSCFVLPSYHEGMANTLLECGAMGRPLITSNIHGCMEAVQDGLNGFLCNVKDVESLCEKMEAFVALSYEDRRKMGENSRSFIADKFDKNKVVGETIEVLYSE